MTRIDIFDVVQRLRGEGRPFALATVVRTADVTSAKAGAKAAVTAEGEILGHLGGACVAGAVRKAAAAALDDGTVRMIRVKPAATVVALRDADGAELHRSGCPSGGTVDVLIEPYGPAPLVVVLGETPVAAAIVRQARLLGYRTAAPEGVGPADRALGDLDLGALGLRPQDFVIVAAQGRRDMDCLRAALGSPAEHVAMVASRRKAAALVGRLRDEGAEPAALARLKSPAGLDLGGVDPAEIALSVVAEIVQVRNARRAAAERAAAQA
jgi:xanthine dehydrogenase accessory factor